MDYAKLCPTLSKHILEETITADTAKAETEVATKPSMTENRVKAAYDLLLVDPQYTKIASEVGLLPSQVKKLHQELMAYKYYTEPVEAIEV